MFKSVFGKYLTAFIAIIVVCFSMMYFIMAGVLTNYAEDAKEESVENVAQTVAAYWRIKLSERSYDVDESKTRKEIAAVARLVLVGTDNLATMISDEEGVIVAMEQSGNDKRISSEPTLPEQVMVMLRRGESVTNLEDFSDTFGESRLVYAVPVCTEDAVFHGAVIVCSLSTRWTGLMNVVTKTMLMSGLWVMLATLIAVYFISERVSAPLKDMCYAVKDYASGNFDRRVTVRGNDEIAELAMAFNQMAQSLDNLEKTRSTFMANVSHDLRTPMTTISGFIDAIRDGVIPPEKQDYYLGIVSDEVHRLSRLVSSLLDLTRIQAGQKKFVKEPFDICEMGRQILISFEQQIDKKQLQVEFICDEDSMMAEADYDAVYQIFYNICDNAVKFSVDGGILRVSIRHSAEKNNKLQVSVYNQGKGIAAEDLPFVFERFFKADKSRGLDRMGAGLGLYIAKTIISAHGEDIWVTSEEGKDCQFNFTLPAGTTLPPHSRENRTHTTERNGTIK